MSNRIEKLSPEHQQELGDIINEMRQSNQTANAAWKSEILQMLKKRGFHVQTSCAVPERGDGRGGRVPVQARKDGLLLAIEFGNQTVRQRSAVKFSQVDERAIRLVGLRVGDFNGPAEGIDHVFSRCALLASPAAVPDHTRTAPICPVDHR